MYVIYEIKSSSIVQDCVNNSCVAVVLKLKQLVNFCFTIQTTYKKEKPFRTTSNLFFLIFGNKMTLLLVMFFSLAIPLLMTLQIQLS